MKVAIVNLTGGGLSGGYTKYLTHLLPALGRLGLESADVYLPPATFRAMRDRVPNANTWPVNDHRTGYRSLRAAVAARNPDVVFVPTARHFGVASVPTVVMVRNMEPLARPFIGLVPSECLRNVGRAAVAYYACRTATRIIAVSGYVRDFLTQRFRIDAGKIGVVPHGVDERKAPSVLPPSSLPTDWSEFVFTAGSIRPARGLEDLVGALGVLRSRGVTRRLVIAGTVDSGMLFYRRDLERQARRLGVSDSICWAGHLDPAQMSWCLLHCHAFVMTSRAEACPNMVLEAMSHGCASISCDGAPMPEFFGDASLYYRTGDVLGLADRLSELALASVARTQELRDAGLRRASMFTWHNTARNTITQLSLAIDGGRSTSSEALR